MKVLFLCTYYHTALIFRQQMDALAAYGMDVLAFNSARKGEPIAPKFVPIMDDRVVHSECWGPVDRALYYPRQAKTERALLNAYDPAEFDLVHAHLMLGTGRLARRIKKRFGVPYVVSVRKTDLSTFIRLPHFKRLAKRILSDASGILFLSNVHRRELFDKYLGAEFEKSVESKCRVIGNCLERFWQDNALTQGRRLDGERVRLLTVANIKPIKNIPSACRAVELLRDRGIDATLTVVGENQNDAEYERVKAFPSVTVLPFKSKEELIDIYRSHDIFVLPSKTETFGRTYVEAMSQGLPVIYSHGAGFNGYYEDGEVGYAVDGSSSESIAEAVCRAVRDYDRLSAACTVHCADFFEERIMGEIARLYEEAAARR